MTGPGHQGMPVDLRSAYEELIPALSRRLAAAGMGVEVSSHPDACQLTVLGAVSGKSLVALHASGQARWYYEPGTGPRTPHTPPQPRVDHCLPARRAPQPGPPGRLPGSASQRAGRPVPAGPGT